MKVIGFRWTGPPTLCVVHGSKPTMSRRHPRHLHRHAMQAANTKYHAQTCERFSNSPASACPATWPDTCVQRTCRAEDGVWVSANDAGVRQCCVQLLQCQRHPCANATHARSFAIPLHGIWESSSLLEECHSLVFSARALSQQSAEPQG